VLTANDTYSGTTTISAGTLQIGDGKAATGGISGPIADNAALVFDVVSGTSVTNVISGSGTLTQSGPGIVTLTGANTYAGGTTVTGTGGTNPIAALINFNSPGNFGTGLITLNGGGLQWATGNTADISASLAPIAAGGTFDTNGNNVAFATALTGVGGVTKAGAGVLTFKVHNSYQGGTTVTGGLINFTDAGDFGPGKITLNGGGLQWAAGTATDISPNLAAIGANGGTFDTNTNIVTLAGVLSGAGGITATGAGSLTLTATETYTGGTTISPGGTLIVGNGTTIGSITGTGNVVDNGTLTFAHSDSVTFDGAISGNGALNWSGPLTLTLTGNNSAFTGTTTINGPLVINATGNTALTGVIQGSGSLTQNSVAPQGVAVLTLGGTNAYTGGTFVNSGLINFSTKASFGSQKVSLNGGGLQWAQGTNFDISSDLNPIGANGATFDTNGNNVSFATALASTTGGVTKAGAGVLTFTVDNAYQGGTTVTGGLINFTDTGAFGSGKITLNGGGLQWGANNTTDISPDLTALGANGGTFDTNGNNVTLATALTGAGGITKAGAGMLTLSPVEGYTGATNISGGVLLVTGSIATSSGVTVQSGGTLAGSGTVSSLLVQSGGSVAPGAAQTPTTLNVAGNAVFQSGSTYVVNVTAGGLDRLSVSGKAGLAGTLELVPSAAGGFTLGQPFTVLSASNGVSGTFGTIGVQGSFGKWTNGATLVPVASYSADTVVVTLEAQTISPFLPANAGTNPKNVAAAIDSAMVNDGAVALFAPLTALSPQELLSSLASFSGEVAVTAQSTSLSATDGFIDTLADASMVGPIPVASRTGARAVHVAPAQMGASSGAEGLEVWIAGGGARDNVDANAKLGSHASTSNDVAGIFGIGYRAPSGIATVGLALGYDQPDFKLSGDVGKGRANGYQGGVYGSMMVGANYVDAIATFESYNVTTTRPLTFNGANVYQGKVASNGESIRMEVGQHILASGGWFTPYINGAVQELDTPAYAETTVQGSPTFALSYTKQNHTDITSELGGEYDTGFPSRAHGLLTMHFRLGWLHDYSGQLHDVAAFQGFTDSIFTVRATSPSKDAAHAILGLEEDLGSLALTLDADGLYGKTGHSYGGRAGLALRL
jgi:autotransporter-associated beta strand protein